MTCASSDGWIRVDYMGARPTTDDGRATTSLVPAVPINVRNPGAAAGSEKVVRGRGVMDTGANMSAVPMWAAEQLGIALKKESKQVAFGVSGTFEAYRVRICVEARLGSRWADIGVIEALVPDTEPSRDPTSHVPFLLGRNGFFDKFGAYFDEVKKAVWLRRAGGGPPAAAVL